MGHGPVRQSPEFLDLVPGRSDEFDALPGHDLNGVAVLLAGDELELVQMALSDLHQDGLKGGGDLSEGLVLHKDRARERGRSVMYLIFVNHWREMAALGGM